jgi:hypothetical protein
MREPALDGPGAHLTIQFLEWLSDRPRTYGETMDAWRTSCPRLSIWEDGRGRKNLRVAAVSPSLALKQVDGVPQEKDGEQAHHGPGEIAPSPLDVALNEAHQQNKPAQPNG